MVKGLVSIITPTFNCASFIGQTIQSIQSQTYANWELLIVDDCSTDDTSDVVRAYLQEDSRITYVRLDKNSGPAQARNASMGLAKGEYMAFCDSDDLWMPEKLQSQLDFMKANGHSFSCTSYQIMNESGDKLGRVIRAVKKCDYNRMLLDCPVGNSSVMYNVARLGRFTVPDIRKRNDDALWLQMLKKEKYIWGMPQVLMKYRIRGNSVSRKKVELIKYHWQLYREIEHLSVFRSAFHVLYWIMLKILRIK